ncbi:MAG: hypothetical protein CMI36_11925 [Owenweeksia sp.]|nr:hypothetical protein [Owenweeksia sp.]MBF99690.1 hypothetical protein [Owenweeksia sp.]HBF18800.1 hypothetical protein [Cryomorphaceae bacterium]HCQ16606.1 hypothetical protein [Cryomorphaceae bacterium]
MNPFGWKYQRCSKAFWIFLFCWVSSTTVFAQEPDTTAEASKDSVLYGLVNDTTVNATAEEIEPKDTAQTHSVATATWLSTAFPGLGQIYNRKYWKLPIVYGALGTTIYFIIDNNKSYHYFLDGFYQITATPENDRFLGVYDERQLIELQNIYRKWRDLNIVLAGVAYALNILDAHVDAHLYYYDIDDDLTFRWEPTIIRGPGYHAMGVSLKLTIK